jgi:chromosome segregation ATPase
MFQLKRSLDKELINSDHKDSVIEERDSEIEYLHTIISAMENNDIQNSYMLDELSDEIDRLEKEMEVCQEIIKNIKLEKEELDNKYSNIAKDFYSMFEKAKIYREMVLKNQK